MNAKYRWGSPHEWLLEKAQSLPAAELYSIIDALAWRLDSDSIQDLFQSEMDVDGYFDKEGEAS